MIPPDIERVALIGWHIYPASRKTKAACIKNPTRQATCDLNQIALWCQEFPSSNWRVVFGPSQLWGLDVDTVQTHAHDGIANLKALIQIHGSLPPRPMERTGGGGLGIFFRHSGEQIIGDAGYPAPGIDPRRGPQSQMIPPSVHITTGQPYRWLVPPWEVSAPTAPGWLLNLVKPKPQPDYRKTSIDTTDSARRRLYKACSAVVMAGPGERNATLNKRAYYVGRLIASGMLGEQEAIEQLYGAARTAGLDHIEIKATLRSGITSGLRKPWTSAE